MLPERLTKIGRLWLLFAVVNFPMLATLPLSIDAEVSLRPDYNLVWIPSGRWVSYLLDTYILPPALLPFFPVAFFGLCAAVSYPILISAYRLKPSFGLTIAFVVFSSFPVWSCVTEFGTLAPVAGIALLVCSVGVYLQALSLDKPDLRSALPLIVGQVLCLALANSTYQAFLSLYVCLSLFMLILNGSYTTFRNVGLLIVIYLCSLVTYYISQLVSFHISGMSAGYAYQYLQIDAIKADPNGALQRTLRFIFQSYFGMASIYGAPIWASGALLLLSTWRILQERNFRTIGLFLVFLVTPFPLLFAAGGALPLRALVAIPVVVWAFVVILLRSEGKIWSNVAIGLICLVGLQSLAAISQYEAERYFVRTFDQSTATSLYAGIWNISDLSKPQQVEFFGGLQRAPIFHVAFGSTAGGSFFAWDGGNPKRIVSYFHALGLVNIVQTTSAEHRNLQPMFANMPVWPAPGSIKMFNDIVLVKLGNTPGYYAP